jgi:phosphoglycerate dehydrogenase-like enzyme
MIGANEFGMMKPGVILINVSRGKVVDTEASSTESSGR